MCWYCYWGWPRPVADIYRKALEALEGDDGLLRSFQAHAAWDDCNFDRASIQKALDLFDEGETPGTPSQMAIVRRSLEELLMLPDDQRDVEPKDFPAGSLLRDYPPPAGLEMVRMHCL